VYSFRLNFSSGLNEALPENELYRHMKGSFTGTFQDHLVRFEAVNRL
jgi:transcriptional regulator with GAF, ATPase, and Fis domain